ncbi:MAG: electron transfer flavoprotein subunit beta/FixA family protein [Desulfobacterales bacterium]|nr:electron transfer flavoprotein subunit beta/FixA family protein [Desulfobacterales bacterium]
MKILVCVKQVADMDAQLDLDQENGWLAEDSAVEYRMNRFDEFALEEAVRIKETHPGTRVDVLSLGPARVADTLKRAIGMGADHGIHIDHPEKGFLSPEVTAELIGRYTRHQKYDFILTGVMAEDDMHCLVGPMLAGYLNIPCAVSVIRTFLNTSAETITVTCELEGGIRQKVRLSLPAVLTVQSGINRPRYPSLSNILRSRKQELQIIPAKELSEQCSDTMLQSVSLPPRSDNLQFIEGSLEEKAEKLLNILHEKSLLKLSK